MRRRMRRVQELRTGDAWAAAERAGALASGQGKLSELRPASAGSTPTGRMQMRGAMSKAAFSGEPGMLHTLEGSAKSTWPGRIS